MWRQLHPLRKHQSQSRRQPRPPRKRWRLLLPMRPLSPPPLAPKACLLPAAPVTTRGSTRVRSPRWKLPHRTRCFSATPSRPLFLPAHHLRPVPAMIRAGSVRRMRPDSRPRVSNAKGMQESATLVSSFHHCIIPGASRAIILAVKQIKFQVGWLSGRKRRS